jgi:ATP-dependent exoDNAse (exonuclease V) beta subunit
MSMNEVKTVPDARQRERALDPAASFIVQAPAGSGKTELLIQRFLALLARVERPEEIAAITFTIKAAAEMRGRIFEALGRARDEACPPQPHEARTWQLARAALERNDALGWKLEESADRLRVQTIDALCASLTRQMPVLSQFGAQPESLEDATALYAQAAHNVVLRLEEGGEVADDVARLLSHVDNNAAEAQRLIADMLMRRDHWIRTLHRALDRPALEAALAQARRAAAAHAHAIFPKGHDIPPPQHVDLWIAFANGLLTQEGAWRKNPVADRFKDDEELRRALEWLQCAPPPEYSDAQWGALEAIVRLSPHAVSELQYVFSVRRQCDFVEVAQAALRALGQEGEPTDLMLALDYRIGHILVDEFQDTSFTQFDLLERLTAGWEPGDGRTLFLVGDPMQSIYRFREAEVGLFLRAWTEGIGQVPLEPLTLSANFRSQAGIVEWVNRTFEAIMPSEEDIHSGAVKYAHSDPVHPPEDAAVQVHAFFEGDAQGEAARVACIAREALAEGSSAAILVRNRSHLLEIMPKLREAKLPFRAIEIEQLGHRPVVQDLLSLARAIAHPGDRTAWLAVLRAPWCGLRLADLHAIAAQPETSTIWEGLNDPSRAMSAQGRGRSETVRQVLGRALAQRSRSSLRAAVERAWLALGGPACVEDPTDLEDAEIFLDHLEASEVAGALPDLDAFEESLGRLYALPDLAAPPDCLQVMTIHKAKGLEFDVVIVPALGSGSGRDDRKLFMWMETPSRSLLLAPINPSGKDDDPIYEYIRELDKEKADHENGRLLYVAATRARRRLHLLGDTRLDDKGNVREPGKGCLLRKLWPAVKDHFVAPRERPVTAPRPAIAPEQQSALRRLVSGSVAFDPPPGASWAAPPERAPFEAMEFSWVGDTARKVGSVVHRWLQRIAEDQAQGWTKKRVERERGAITRELIARGVVESDLGTATERVVAALSATLEDKRGKWILGPQRGARNEYRLSMMAGGVRRMLVIDRMFEDDVGDTWIVDYKTSTHEGADMEAFLASEQERYREQLERYVVAVDKPQARRGLYFPLLKGWREWY